jgi:hypothetical protein
LLLATVALAASGVLAACSSDEGGEGNASPPSSNVDVDGSVLSPDGAAYPPLPPYVVDNTPLSPDYSIFEHGKECYDRFQVEVPSFDCDGPDSSRLKIEVDGVEVTGATPSQCDKPSLVGTNYACVPGARVTKFQSVNKYGHTIATVVACRRSTASALDSGKFDNIAILQSDLQNNESCWYQLRESTSYVARNIPSPYGVGRTKGDAADKKAIDVYESPITLTTDHSECYRCHDSQVWLRTPWISVKNQTPSASGNVNEIPRTQGEPTFLGKAYRDWNLPASRPKQIKIDKAAFDQALPLTAPEQAAIQAGTMAPSDACTQCHSIGKSELATSGQGTCNHFARYWMSSKPSSFDNTVLGSKVSGFGNSFPRDAWMPPSAATTLTSDSAYQDFYGRAFKAIEVCCDDPSAPGCKR